MDVQLQELIDKIKKDGVASAENSAGKIIAEAEKKAAAIIKEAESKADSIIKAAKAETERMEKASEDAITQAGRNLIISFRDGINREVSALVQAETEKAYDKDLLKKLIPETVKAWSANPSSDDLCVLLPSKELKVLEASLKSALKAKISKGLEIKGDSSLASGFRIGAKNGSAFYDFSADEVASLFSAYLNPKTTELMKKAAAGISPEKAEGPKPAAVKKPAADAAKPAAKKTVSKPKAAKKPASKKGSK
ncbi:MAG: V-type ATP synthase subunit E [Treponema sp.]|nr:V-type ATP synthase subunit E [Treponema sp.]